MLKNLRRLVLVHIALGVGLIVVYALRPSAMRHPLHMRGRMLALSVIGMVVLAWAPFLISGFYACNSLVERDPKAAIAFSWSALAIFIVAACLSLNLASFQNRPSNLAVSLGVTVALLAAARLCAGIWKAEARDPFWE
jgi:hypothetical protein